MKKRIIIIISGVAAVLLIAVGVLTAVFFSQIKTIVGTHDLGDGVYSMRYDMDYKLDEVLSDNITDEKALEQYIKDNLYFAYEMGDYSSDTGAGTSTNDEALPGGPDSDFLVTYTAPTGGFRSIAKVNLSNVHIGESYQTKPATLGGKLSMFSAPYLPSDGVNEKGVGVAMIYRDSREVHQHSEKPDTTIGLVVRKILDTAATAEDALKVLEQYDLNSAFGYPRHLLIVDKSGSSYIAELTDDGVEITDISSLSHLDGDGEDTTDAPVDSLIDRFSFVLTEDGGNSYLASVHINYSDEWSEILNLTDFCLDICGETPDNGMYHFDADTF